MKPRSIKWFDVFCAIAGGVSLALLVLFTAVVVFAPVVLDDQFSRPPFVPLVLLLWLIWFLLYVLVKPFGA